MGGQALPVNAAPVPAEKPIGACLGDIRQWSAPHSGSAGDLVAGDFSNGERAANEIVRICRLT